MTNQQSPSPNPQSAIPDQPDWWSRELEAELRQVYDEVDEEIRATGVVCEARGLCCDFDRSPHVLYASSIEIRYVRELHPEPFSAGSRLCPFWADGLCTSRERRPLGCRTYFCDDRHREALQEIYERHYSRLKEIAGRYGSPWTYEPFVPALRGV